MATKRTDRGKRFPRTVIYEDENYEDRDGILRETNGNLSYIEDAETGEGRWLSPHEWWDWR